MPKSVVVIGTMNTADRSIALVNAAMRRRFAFVLLPAVYAPGGLERTWRTAILPLLEEHHYGGGVDVLARYGLDVIRARVAARVASGETGTPGGESSDSA